MADSFADFERKLKAIEKDMAALRSADATVLVLPCGRSAHLELGWAAGSGQRTVVLLDDPIDERQADSTALRFRREERLEQPRSRLGVHSRSAVGDLEERVPAEDLHQLVDLLLAVASFIIGWALRVPMPPRG